MKYSTKPILFPNITFKSCEELSRFAFLAASNNGVHIFFRNPTLNRSLLSSRVFNICPFTANVLMVASCCSWLDFAITAISIVQKFIIKLDTFCHLVMWHATTKETPNIEVEFWKRVCSSRIDIYELHVAAYNMLFVCIFLHCFLNHMKAIIVFINIWH